MGIRFFSSKNRAFHLGPYPLERLKRADTLPDLSNIPRNKQLEFSRLETPHSLVNAMGEYQAMMDAIRDGIVNPVQAEIPDDLTERAEHLKSFGYFQDASMVGICEIPAETRLAIPTRNPDIDRLSNDIKTKQTKTLASGIDQIMAELKEAIEAPLKSIDTHTHALVFLFENTRPPNDDEPGTEWIKGAQEHRAALRATEAAVITASYLHLLG
ncbi:MAG: NAD-binding oxidoreductase, partial [Paracoccaceae bacterium]|nr:NAD-binding oxidoreductase [Paracoccaceae bacterium]